MIIHDGTGKNFDAKVDSINRLSTRGVVIPPLEDHSERTGTAAFIVSTYAATADQEVLSIENGEDEHFHITRLHLGSSVQALWTLFEVTSGTPGGTSVTYQNPNLASGINKSITVFGNASVTGSLAGNTLGVWESVAGVSLPVFLEGAVLLGKADKIAITVDATGTVAVLVIGFWES